MTSIVELYGVSTAIIEKDWVNIVNNEHCPYLQRKCIKVRKSNPDITIGTCTVLYGKEKKKIIICPHRLLERNQIFIDCLHLLTHNEPGNELHIVHEVGIPGGNVDYFLVATRYGKIRDFVGVELQTLDSTGTVWPHRQKLLQEQGLPITDMADNEYSEIETEHKQLYERPKSSKKGFGMNWKMTAKTILMQLHHKVQTFEHINKHLVMVIQDHFYDYMSREFRFSHVKTAKIGDSMQIHVYSLAMNQGHSLRLDLGARYSTDAQGIAESLGLQADARLELDTIVRVLESKLSAETVFLLR
ncbi:NotI family restriction endonuclease [Candidatus Viridilinea mediisalina]|uniref:Uncharacterized protein n=1 Tax=Candidatus Viridilinea mediisalina TaxID=2024553 RepID=A0A2A6RPE6_9CHLR|nr:NotI family restriction endonuclease [Candidatus Viridilinea mediisalina]PDW04786.1 hypothetical protein CJ255_01715 [Candidatus Viridilinea mediisalina]